MNQELIGKKIKELRIKNNLTQNELANKLNVTYQAVSKWENGKNLPDLSVMSEICKIFNIELSELIGDNTKKKSNKKVFILVSILLVVIVLLFIIFFDKNDDYEMKPLTTTCEEFEISGVAAYNKEKTSIYISNISYCGKEEDLVFKEIECVLYEETTKEKIKVNNCMKVSEETNLKDYLSELKINIEHFSTECKHFKENNLYLEITGKNDDEKIITYKIPLKLEEDCN